MLFSLLHGWKCKVEIFHISPSLVQVCALEEFLNQNLCLPIFAKVKLFKVLVLD